MYNLLNSNNYAVLTIAEHSCCNFDQKEGKSDILLRKRAIMILLVFHSQNEKGAFS